MKSLNIYFFLLLFVIGWSGPFQGINAHSGSNPGFSPFMSCPNTCQVSDSLALVAIFNSTNGSGWTSTWNLNTPVCSWSGVTLNASGHVEILNLNARNLTGSLPSDIGNLSYIESLRLDNNNLTGTIPSSIGNLTALKIIFLDNNALTGSIPASFANLTNLITLFLDNNQLSGTVPAAFNGLTGLQEFYINSNRFDSIPVLSGMITLQVQNERFRIDNNRLTFDDIVVHGPTTVFDHYSPQDSVFTAMSLTLPTGSSYTIDLGFDSSVANNVYQWYKDGLPFGPPLTTNKLTLTPITFAHTGEYRCQVTNTSFTQLTLHTRPVTINVICGNSILTVNDTLCYGDSRTYNGTTYDASLPSGTELLTGADQYGCDSSIVVNLSFRPENIFVIDDTLCASDTVFVDGVAYHQNNATGTNVLENADQFGCDSTVIVDLSFRPENTLTINSTLCAGDTLFVGSTAYHQNNTAGTTVLENADQFGCDSTVIVDLTFRPENMVNINSTLCAGDTLFVGSTAYHQNNTAGTTVLENADQFGCDSTVIVNLGFRPENTLTINSTLCAGDTLFVGSTAYHQNNAAGTTVLENADQFGCDSTVIVDLTFRPENTVNINATLCAGDTVFVGSTAYHQNNTAGTTVLENADQFGCDSTVIVDLTFRLENTVNINATLCPGDTVFVGSTAFHQNNTAGTTVLENADQFGCDSTVIVDLTFRLENTVNINATLCPGDTVFVGSTAFHQNNTAGTIVLENADQFGCDSTVIIDLTFRPENTVNINATLCAGDTLFVGSTAYHQNNTSGTTVLENADQFGCDSTVIVDLSFRPENTVTLNSTHCAGDTLFVGSTAYHQNNTSGTTVLESADQFGCDSTVIVDLSFRPENTVTLNSTHCAGDTLFVGSTAYHQNNTAGTTVLENADQFGCDSTVIVDLSFRPENTVTLNSTHCAGDTLFVGSTAYHQNNTAGTTVLENADQFGCDSTVIVDLTFRPENTVNINATLCTSDTVFVGSTAYHQNNTAGTTVLESADQFGCDSTVIVDLTFRPENTVNINATLCTSDTVFVGSTAYHQNNTAGTTVLESADQFGCDSTVIVDLTFRPENTVNINATLCAGDTLFVGSTAYHQNNTAGTTVLENADQFGCDSTVIVDLSFYPDPSPAIVQQTICASDSLFVHDRYLDFSNPSATIILENQSYNGCDSLIEASVDFYPIAPGTETISLCEGESIVINGVTFDESNPSGSVLYGNASQNGCDSTVNISVNFLSQVSGDFTATLCPGESVMINGTVYDESNPSGTETFMGGSYLGCDSTVQISLSFNSTIVENITPTLCQGESITVNGTLYNESNPDGTEMLPGGSYSGCDSTIVVDLSFYPSYVASVNEVFCPGESLVVNGTLYDEFNATGVEVIPNGSSTGCDSTVNINISFYAQISSSMTTILCPGESLVVNGVTYDASNPSGTEILAGASFNGCDSTVLVDLDFHPPAVENIISTLCPEDTVWVGGVAYHTGNTSGTEIIAGASINGCDSTVHINLSFYEPAEGELNLNLCPEQGVFINGTTYNESNPSGVETFPNGSVNGCDSVLVIELTFNDNAESTLNPTLCPGESIEVNGVTYDESNPNGVQYFENQADNGCDSTVYIDLTYYNVQITAYTNTLCPGDSVIINGATYNFFNPSGTEILPAASYTGCDSIIEVSIDFYDAPSSTISATLCPGEEMVINDVAYNISNPNGTELFSSSSMNGCDSVVLVDLSFREEAIDTVALVLCPGESTTVNGTLYDEDNPNGTEVINNATAYGCDSTIIVELVFYEPATSFFTPQICAGDTIVVNGTAYHENNLSGSELLPNASAQGCDSIIQVDLSILLAAEGSLTATICTGDTLYINGNAYHQNYTSGTEVLENASYLGCDSLLTVNLSLFNQPTGIVQTTLCQGDTLFYNNNAYYEGNSSGTEILNNASYLGCDSIVQVSVDFSETVEGSFSTMACLGDTVFYNGFAFHQNNNTGSVLLEDASYRGCDSIVLVSVDFFTPAEGNFSSTICPGDTLFYNGFAFHQSNTTGSVLLENASYHGCDSTVQVSVDFFAPAEGNFSSTICTGDTLFYNGFAFHQNNTTGSVLLENASYLGCDSTVQVSVDFFQPSEGNFSSTICPADTLYYGGTAFYQGNSAGTVILENAAANGCDSIVQVALSFYESPQSTFSMTLCTGESITINGSIYNQDNPSGTAIFQTEQGCDSIVNIDLAFLDAVTFDTLANICEGEVFVLADRTFSETGSYDIVLENAASAGCDSIIQITLEVMTPELLGIAELGDDIIQCEQNIALSANQPTGTTGTWTSLDEMNISNPHDNNLNISDPNPGWNTFLWTLSSERCFNYDTDTIRIFVAEAPEANNDQYSLSIEQQTTELDLLENDNFSGVDAFYFELLSSPLRGQLTEMEEGYYLYERADIRADQLDFSYQLCNEDCPDLCDTATVRIMIEEQDIELLDIPNAITPNDDGVNEFFMFPQLEFYPDQYPDNELIIFNRWGNIVYEAKPYLNDWYGQDRSGKPLPQGTYYYVLRLDINQGIILKGDVSILK